MFIQFDLETETGESTIFVNSDEISAIESHPTEPEKFRLYLNHGKFKITPWIDGDVGEFIRADIKQSIIRVDHDQFK